MMRDEYALRLEGIISLKDAMTPEELGDFVDKFQDWLVSLGYDGFCGSVKQEVMTPEEQQATIADFSEIYFKTFGHYPGEEEHPMYGHRKRKA